MRVCVCEKEGEKERETERKMIFLQIVNVFSLLSSVVEIQIQKSTWTSNEKNCHKEEKRTRGFNRGDEMQSRGKEAGEKRRSEGEI